MRSFRVYRQLDSMDCGPTCLRMIARHFGKSFSLEHLRRLCYMNRAGISLLGISEAAEKMGFRTLAAQVSFRQLNEEVPLPCILHWNKSHYIVIPPQNYSDKHPRARITIADPAHGLVNVDKETFLKCWINTADNKGVALMVEPTPSFYDQEEEVV